MARRRLIADEVVLDAAGRVMRRVGAGGLTFALVAAESRLAPATLVQRFRGREQLIEAAMVHAWDRLDAALAFADNSHPMTPEGAISLLVGLSAGFEDLDFATAWVLRAEMGEAHLRSRGAKWHETLSQTLGRRLVIDLAAQMAMGRLLVNQWLGAMIGWGYAASGPLATQVRLELDAWWAAIGSGTSVGVIPETGVPDGGIIEETPTDRIIRLYGDG